MKMFKQGVLYDLSNTKVGIRDPQTGNPEPFTFVGIDENTRAHYFRTVRPQSLNQVEQFVIDQEQIDSIKEWNDVSFIIPFYSENPTTDGYVCLRVGKLLIANESEQINNGDIVTVEILVLPEFISKSSFQATLRGKYYISKSSFQAILIGKYYKNQEFSYIIIPCEKEKQMEITNDYFTQQNQFKPYDTSSQQYKEWQEAMNNIINYSNGIEYFRILTNDELKPI